MVDQREKQAGKSQDNRIDYSLVLAPGVKENPVSYLEDIPKNYKAIFNVILGIYNTTQRNHIYPSLEYICEKTKLSLATVKRCLKFLSSKGLLSKFQRGFNKTNCYRVHPMFLDAEVRKELRFVFRCFYYIPIALLMVVPVWGDIVNQRKHYIFERVSSYKENRNLNNKNLPNPPNAQSRVFAKSTGGKSQKGGGCIRKERIKRMDPRDYKNIERLNLTEAGVIKLSAFPPQAIAAAMIRLQGITKPVDDIFRFVFAVSRQWCEERGEKPNFRETSHLLREKGYTFDSPSIDAENPCVLKAKPTADKEKNRTDQTLATMTAKREISAEREEAAQRELRDKAESGDIWAQLLLGISKPEENIRL